MLQRLRRSQCGAVMVITAISFTILILFAGLALDIGRGHLLRAQLQTAVDAAALAGALQVIPMVEIRVERWESVEEWCTDPVTGEPYACWRWERTSPIYLTGTEWELIIQRRWREIAGADCDYPYRCSSSYRIIREWQILPDSTEPVARDTFYRNAIWPGGSTGIIVTDLTITMQTTPVEVTADATMTAPTHFLRLVGLGELVLRRSGSAVPVKRR